MAEAAIAGENWREPERGADTDAPSLVSSIDRASRPHVGGKFLFLGEEKFWVRGVTYGTFAPDEENVNYPPRAVVEADFASMAANGINTIRLYTAPPRWLLDAAQGEGLWVTVGLPWEQHVTFLDSKARAGARKPRI